VSSGFNVCDESSKRSCGLELASLPVLPLPHLPQVPHQTRQCCEAKRKKSAMRVAGKDRCKVAQQIERAFGGLAAGWQKK